MQAVAALNLQTLLDYFPDISVPERDLIERAYLRAEQAHLHQFRKSGEPFFTHCLAVATILAEMHLDSEGIAAALLHDVVEDTDVTLDELRSEFGEQVARIVSGVTKLNRVSLSVEESKKGKAADRELEYIRNMLLAMGDDVRVVLVKLADRLHNMRTLHYMSAEQQQRKAQETLDVFAPLANRLGIWQVKWELEDLSLRYLQPERYKQIAMSLEARRDDMERYVQTVIDNLRKALAEYGLGGATITGRSKHIFSIYKKMERKNTPISQIYDLRAVRIIVENVMQCYQALGVVHSLWPPLPGEFDDYIAAPKDNFYRSLHTAVLDNHGKTVEVQIRTWEMHEHAEYGVAAHWRYKEGNKKRRDEAYEARIAYLRRLLADGPENADSQSFYATLQEQVFQDRVYVYTPKGDIVDLPKGATPIDFAYHIHTDIGHRCRGAKVHGRLVALNYTLEAGDQIEILTSKRGGPSLDWLNQDLGYVYTTRAKEKIRAWFRKQDREKHLTNGRQVLESELKRLNVEGLRSFDNVAHLFGYERTEDFLVAVGAGDITGPQIANRILEAEHQQARQQDKSLIETMQEAPSSAPSQVRVATDGISLNGMQGMMMTLAQCCGPMYGDPIIGFVTRGRGVSIHRKDCANIKAHTEPERLIEVTWGEQPPLERYPVPVEIIAYDRDGLLKDISTVISDEKVNMTRVTVSTKQNIATVNVTMEIASFNQLTRILNKMAHVQNVIEARRRAAHT